MSIELRTVEYEKSGDIARIYLNRPDRLNALVSQLVEDLCQALDQAAQDDVKVVLLSGRGKAFCAGYDLKSTENEREDREGEVKRRRRFQRIQDVTRKIRQAPFPVVAVVHGYALGAGSEFALCCDLIVAESNAQFGFPEVSVGLGVTGGISHLLPMTVGLAKAKELLFLSERFTAEQAKELGLINFVVEHEELNDFAMNLAQRLSELPQISLSRAKFNLNSGSQTSLETALETEIEHVLATNVSEDAQLAAQKFRSSK